VYLKVVVVVAQLVVDNSLVVHLVVHILVLEKDIGLVDQPFAASSFVELPYLAYSSQEESIEECIDEQVLVQEQVFVAQNDLVLVLVSVSEHE